MSAALLLMDFQSGVVGRLGTPEVVRAAGRALATARSRGIPVVFVRVGFRAGAPETSSRNQTFAAMAGRPEMGADRPETQVVSELAPLDSEVVVVKRRVSAFSGSDLEVVLRSAGIDHLVLTGIATSGVVLSTLREAADRDYRITVLADACGDGDPEVQRVLTEKVFPRQAEVTDVSTWAEGLG
jgi:nicotinamidase-related amidase